MKKRDAIKHFGTGAAVADALGIRPQAVNKWGDIVPYARAVQLQKLTRGKLKPGARDYR
jgi:DNA-binding transcriptional regulator YdaS (Cro superfamily)